MSAATPLKATDPRFTLRAQLAETDLRVEFHRHHQHAYIGARAQLEAENMTPPDGRWPNGRTRREWIQWEDGALRFTLSIEHTSNLRKLYGRLPDDEHYRLSVQPVGNGIRSILQSRIREKLDEIEEIRHIATRESHDTFLKCVEARSDRWFQGQLAYITRGVMPRKGGRPRAQSTH